MEQLFYLPLTILMFINILELVLLAMEYIGIIQLTLEIG